MYKLNKVVTSKCLKTSFSDVCLKNLYKFQFKSRYNSLEQIREEIKEESNEKISCRFKHEKFTKRHIGPFNESDTNEMLKVLGLKNLNELVNQTVPSHIQLNKQQKEYVDKTLGEPISEKSALEYIGLIANENKMYENFIGCGYHPTFVPPVILRNITENPGWYTSYTPYQAEISQGRLETLLHFQTLITELTALPWSNASLLDEATAAAEAMYLSNAAHNGKRNEFFIAEDVFPFIKEVVKTRAKMIGVKVSFIYITFK